VAIEVDRLVNATGLVALAGRQHPVGFQSPGDVSRSDSTAA
jgi:hypothetical protein